MYINRPDHWYLFWEQSRAGKIETLEAAYCLELVNGWDIEQREKDAILGELDHPEVAFCPNITDFEVWKGTEFDQYVFTMGIRAIVDDQDMIENSLVLTSDINRNFNAEQFLEDGF